MNLPTTNVSIFDNMQTFFEQVVFITKNIGHCLSKVPELITYSISSVSDFCSYCPPFVAFIILFMLGSGIILKGTHWGS